MIISHSRRSEKVAIVMHSIRDQGVPLVRVRAAGVTLRLVRCWQVFVCDGLDVFGYLPRQGPDFSV